MLSSLAAFLLNPFFTNLDIKFVTVGNLDRFLEENGNIDFLQTCVWEYERILEEPLDLTTEALVCCGGPKLVKMEEPNLKQKILKGQN
jgi:hypothetical protein